MPLKKLGIVVKEIGEGYMLGELVSTGLTTSVKGDACIQTEEVIRRMPFLMKVINGYNLVETQLSIDLFLSKEICKELQNIGFKNVVLSFNGKEYTEF